MGLFEQILGDAVILKQESESEKGFLTASTHDGRELSIRVFHFNISQHPRDLFKISLVNTPNVGESQVTSLRFKGSNTDTLGYIFPIAALRTGEYLPENRWAGIYAAAATRELVYTEIAAHIATGKVMEVNEFEITDLFPDNIGVLVLGKQQLDEASASIEEVELMLMEYGYFPHSVIIVSSAVTRPAPDYEARISLRRLATHLVDEIVALKWLMASAFLQQTEAGRFLTLYQIVECVLSRVFGKAMEHMIADRRSLTDPWWVRETVLQIQAEKWRLNLIERHCLRPGMSHAAFSDNRESCQKLLIDLSRREPDDNELSWAKALYLVRNIFVHNQAVLRGADESLMEKVCETLQQVCFEVLGGFIDPSSDFLNEGV